MPNNSTANSPSSTAQTDAHAALIPDVQRFLELLYPDPPPDGWLVVSWPVSKDDFHSQWFKLAQADDAARCIIEQAQPYNVYVGVGLRHPDCTTGEHTRGSSADVYTLPGLWVELDHNAGVHAAHNLPTPNELLAFIEGLPFRFSLLVDSGGGYHAYVLFKELWILDTPEERQAAALLLKRFQRTIQAQAAAHSWKVDSTADLARVLRPAGTLNHKSGTPKPVTLLHEDAIRYNPSDIADATWLAIVEDTYTPPAGHGNFPPARLEPIVTGCAWLQHCRDDAAQLPEPEWYGMLGIVGRCEDGEQTAHEWSAPYPRYSKDETAKKLQHALADAGPRTCSTIRFDLGADTTCRDCQHWDKIKSPILLGMTPTMRREAARALIPQRFAAEWPEAADVAQLLEHLVSTPEARLVYDALPTLAALSPDAWQATKSAIKRLVGNTINLSDIHTVWKKAHRPQVQPTPTNGTHPPDATPLVASDDDPLPYSDYTNALTLVRDYGRDLRYCEPWKKWLTWRGTHWQHDQSGAVMRSAKQTIKRLARHVEDIVDDSAARALLAHVKKSLSTAALKAMIDNAWSELGIPVLPEDLDTKAWLLNGTNGTLNLKTGILQPHDRTDLLTRSISVAYDPEAACPTWEKFLWRIMGGTVTPDDPDMSMGELEARQHADIRARALIDFLQCAIGHSLTGDTREQCLFIFWGSGANGKSTLVNTLLALLGPYAMKATAELLMVTRNDRHPTERADLFGTRFVAAIETEEGGRLNEVFVKEATGGDPIRARRMREDFWQFDPTHKVFLATNHKPVIRGTDHAIWRRIKLVPFTVVIPDIEQDKQLPVKLHAELPGILAWAVRGCLDWQQKGLGEPAEVTAATAGYRQEMDVFEGFLADECYRIATAQVKASDLYDAYERWCKANDVEALNKRAFGMRLSDSGFTPEKGTGGTRMWKGIGLPAKEEDAKRSGG